MRRVGVWLISLMLVLVLAACSNGGSSPAAGGQTGTPGAEPAKGEPVELVMYSWRTEDKEAYAKFIAEFEKKHPTIKVKFKPVKSTEYNTILNNSLTSGTGVDIVQLRPYSGTTSIADTGYLLPLDDIAGVKDISPSYLDAAKGSDQKIYGVPLSINSAVIFYNKKLFEDNGLQPPATWEELLQVSQEFQKKGIVPIAQAGKAAYLLSMTHSVIGPSAYGSNEYVEKLLKGEAKFTDEAFKESIKRMQELAPYFPPDFVAIDDKDAQALFYTGKAAMYINGSYRLETFQKQSPDLPIDILPGLAKEKGGETPMINWVDGSYGIAKSTKHPEEAKTLIAFLASKEFGQMFSDDLDRLSAITGVTPKHPLVQKMTQLSEKSMTPYLMLVHFGEGTPTTKTIFEDAMQGLYINQINVDKVAEDTQASADKWFKPKK
ncbi:ABC transporter substrate-binding protein [Brevibacillus sp. NPDC003359]|uniref:ABC transporter substrate-binding protein n=1 Tax=unclassified Brevibacillus TaxID=2684853 RepID=UPI00369A2878